MPNTNTREKTIFIIEMPSIFNMLARSYVGPRMNNNEMSEKETEKDIKDDKKEGKSINYLMCTHLAG
jgi:hypothetical protein